MLGAELKTAKDDFVSWGTVSEGYDPIYLNLSSGVLSKNLKKWKIIHLYNSGLIYTQKNW